ncbi:zinc finger protein on ecdysone puffs isoform X2 [Ixodes scapularis]|uniref:zinc finger protein on ecdysone puffs isoform X2 n=1 Tax=Ixodes scapularis TaxID=6945 RepID=UPI001A9EBF18|nr:zinc finger protein on ecdysone puffs isoform X2 [Ixodes scapularis]
MSRRSAPDSPWQNGVPPFGLGQQFSPMMNVSPVWGQANLPFMGGGNMMSPDMMRFGGNVSSRSNFRRYYDQPDNRYRGQQRNRGGGGYGDNNGRYGRNQQNSGRGESRKRFANRGDGDRSPPAKRPNLSKKEAPKKVEKAKQKVEGDEAEEAVPREEEEEELYDPAEPTNDAAEAATNGDAEKDGVAADEEPSCQESEGKESEAAADSAAVNDEGGADGEAEQAREEGGEGDEAAPKAKEPVKAAASAEATPAAKPSATPSKAAEGKVPVKTPEGKASTAKTPPAAKTPQPGQKGPSRPASEASAKSDSRREQESKGYQKKGSQRGKGWCTVCELHFVGSFLDHRRAEDHKIKRDEKYPKCHPCSMGFNNKKQFELHCAGDFHRKNVEVLDNEVDETAGPLGEEYLEEAAAFFCTLCKLLLKADMKTMHCRTQGHYRRHRDLKRKEEAALKAQQAKEEAEKKQKEEEEEEDVSQMAFTITDEIVSDDEGKADAGAPTDKAPAAEAPEAPVEPEKEEERTVQPPVEENKEEEKEPETNEQREDEASETMDTGEAGQKEAAPTEEAPPAKKENVAEPAANSKVAVRGRGRGKVTRGGRKK